jgi:hypothetical protein
LSEIFERKRSFWEPRYRCEDIIKMSSKGIDYGAEDWTGLNWLRRGGILEKI